LVIRAVICTVIMFSVLRSLLRAYAKVILNAVFIFDIPNSCLQNRHVVLAAE